MKCRLERADLYAFALLASISSLCIVVFLLPADVQELLRCRSDSLNLLSLWTSAFVHFNFEHLLYDVVSFLVLGLLVFAVHWKPGRGKDFLYSLIVILLVLPPVTNALFALIAGLVFKRVFASCGLSIIVAGLAGLMVPSLRALAKGLLKSEERANKLVLSLMLLTLFWVVLQYVHQVYGLHALASWAAILVLGALLVCGLALLIPVVKELRHRTERDHCMKEAATTSIVAVIGYLVFVIMLFPSEIITPGGGLVGVFHHYLGLFLGMLFGAFVPKLRPLRGRSDVVRPGDHKERGGTN